MNSLRNCFIGALASIILLMVSCTHEDIIPQNTDGEAVDVAIGFTLPDMQKKTRSSLSEDAESQISNVYLFIFDAQTGINVHRELQSYGEDNLLSYTLIVKKKLIRGRKYRFYAIANVGDAQQLFSLSEESLDDTWDEDLLKALILKLPDNKLTVSRFTGHLLMSGTAEKTIVKPATGNETIDVPLYRLDVKVTFNITAANSDITFVPNKYRVMRLPKGALCFADPTAVVSTDKNDYFDTPESFLEDSGDTFTFYMLENLSTAQKNITATNKPYKQRAKQKKAPNGSSANPTVTNGDFENAPVNGTYVEITGDFTKKENNTVIHAQTKYYVHLGYINNDVNDYAAHRNTHYTYNITVTDVNDLIVEAKEDNNEPDPRAEGHVIKSDNEFTLDSHYETVSVLLDWSRFFKANGEKRAVSFKVITPFDEGVNEQAKDMEWVKFSPTPGNAYPDFRSYRDALNAGELWTAQELVDKIHAGQFSSFTKDNPLAVTVFVDEYYYQKNPVTGAADLTLWKEFVNKPDRWFMFATTQYVSSDGNTTMDENFLTIRQKSIKTYYNTKSNYERAWGIESVVEGDKRLAYTMALPTDDRLSGGVSGKDGRYNTLREFSVVTSIATPVDHTRIGFDADGWNKAVDSKTNRMKERYNYIRFACLSRNRDLNGDGKIDADEVRWYLPAIGQLIETWMMNEAMPFEARLFKGNTFERLSFSSSTAYETGNNSNNPMTLWAQAGSMFTARSEAGRENRIDGDHWSSLSNNYFRAYYRCVRNLGIPQQPDETYPEDNIGETPSTPTGLPQPQTFYTFDKATNTFDMSAVDPKALRMAGEKVEQGELMPHSHLSSQNRFYKKMQVAKNYAKKGNTVFDYNEAYITFGPAWRKGDSPCKNYSELPDKSDKGTWRVPNERELALILRNTYEDGEKKPDNNFWSCTSFAFPSEQFSNPSGFFQYQKGTWYNMINIKDGPLYYSNSAIAKVRCVRDVD